VSVKCCVKPDMLSLIPEQPDEASIQPVLAELVYCRTWGSFYIVWLDKLDDLVREAERERWHLIVRTSDWMRTGRKMPTLIYVTFVC